MSLFNNDSNMAGIYRAKITKPDSKENKKRIYIPSIHTINPYELEGEEFEKALLILPEARFDTPEPPQDDFSCYIMFESGNIKYPVVVGFLGKELQETVVINTGNSNEENNNILLDGGGESYDPSSAPQSVKDYLESIEGTPAKEWGAGTGTQCVELSKHYIDTVYGTNIKNVGLGNGNEIAKNIGNLDGFSYYPYSSNLQIKPGDILSLEGVQKQYGHTGVVKSVSGNQITMLEQWNGSGTVIASTFTITNSGKRRIIGLARHN